MTGNCHVRFLGGKAVVTPLTQPIEREQEPEAVYLWDNKVGTVANGINYFEEEGDETS